MTRNGQEIRLPDPANREGQFSTGRDVGTATRQLALLGQRKAIYAGYAPDARNRKRVASGGVVSALMVHMLEQHMVDGVGLCRTDFSEGRLGYEFKIVTDPEEIAAFATSSYFNIPIEKHWKEIDRFNGEVALCALPCHTSILHNRKAKDRGLGNVKIFLSLFCGHNNEPDLNRFVLQKAGIREDEVANIHVDRTYLGGDVIVELRGGKTKTIPFRHFNVYRSLWFFSKPMCRYCDDHLGAASDISVGDIFVPEYRRKRIQHSAIIARSELGYSIVEEAKKKKKIRANKIDPEVLFRAQKRIVVPSADIKSRYLANRIAGFPAKRSKHGRFRLRTFITYSLLHMNDRLSESSAGRKIIWYTPKPILYAYIALIKIIHNTLRP